MDTTRIPYHRLRLLIFAVLGLLVFMQVNWLRRAVILQKQQLQQQLQLLVPEMALRINEIDHTLFHGLGSALDSFPIVAVEKRINSILEAHGLEITLAFAIFQDSVSGIFHSNNPEFEHTLRQSKIRACMSCIISFSVMKDLERLPEESDQDFLQRQVDQSEFKYFSPVNQLKRELGEVTWLSLYVPGMTSHAMGTLIFLFVANLVLLLGLLFLTFYLLRTLSHHKWLSKVKEDFFNNLTHEFKTPLASIRLASRVLRQSVNAEKNHSYHLLIEKECRVLELHVDQLLLLSLVDRKGWQLDRKQVDLHVLLSEIPKRLQLQIEAKAAYLHFELHLKSPKVLADSDHLLNCFCNLVENSLKYAPNGVHIWVSTHLIDHKVVVKIRDNGPGIPAEFQEHVFERFFRVKKGNQYKGQGFGIGLSYVKGVIEAHQGIIWLNVAYRDGCEFVIEL